MKKIPPHLLPYLTLVVLTASVSLSWAQPPFWTPYCGTNGNYTSNSSFAADLNTFLSSITSSTQQLPGNDTHFYKVTVGSKPGIDLFTGEAFCRADLSSSDCVSCSIDAARKITQICPNQKRALGWYSNCALWYSDATTWGVNGTYPMLLAPASSNNASDPVAFDNQLRTLFMSLKAKTLQASGPIKAASGSRSVNESLTIYAVSLCVPDLSTSDCSQCLEDIINYIPTCCYGKTGSAVFAPNCAGRFDVYQFYTSADGQPPPHSGKGRSLKISLPIVISTLVMIMVAIWTFRRRKKAKQTVDNNYLTHFQDEMKEIVEVESWQFDLTTIQIATQNFSFVNKLGEGGFGEVYKGRLANGQEIAVKRLSKNSGQGISEFKTELDLVAKLQHKNLVTLLGFCMTSNEMILIYEFVRNSSLDRFLFDGTKKILLDWDTRFKIIHGIARGLLYLHEDSRLKVIHRDLKTSNILLDEMMNPKISDFGLAKLFRVDETQAKTKRIVGTYGYMAPEYAITGHLSVKSDVFSFGVIVLEIVSGQKNRYSGDPEVEEALLHRAWRLWNEQNILDLVDLTLQNKYSKEEITRCIHVGLLSIQEVPFERPRMSSIVATLNGESIILPEPKAPQFFGTERWITSSPDKLNPEGSRHAIDDLEMPSSQSGTTSITELYPR